MTDEEMKLSSEAKQVVESAACRSVLDAMVMKYRKGFEESDPDQGEEREHCYVMLRATKEVLKQLTILATKGKLESVRQSRGGNSSAL